MRAPLGKRAPLIKAVPKGSPSAHIDGIQTEHARERIEQGTYNKVLIIRDGSRSVDIASMYNTDRYRPQYDHKLGLPIFLTRP